MYPSGSHQPFQNRGLPPKPPSIAAPTWTIAVGAGLAIVVVAIIAIAVATAPAKTVASVASADPIAASTPTVSLSAACERDGGELIEKVDPEAGASSIVCVRAKKVPDGDVSKSEWEKAHGANSWPFKPSAGTVRCQVPNMVFFVAEGRRYALNGHALACVPNSGDPIAGHCLGPARNVEEIWLDDPSPPHPLKVGDTKISIGDMISYGLGLCAP